MRLDKKDLKILEQLDKDARQSNTQIGKQVRLSKDAVGYRIKNLEKSEVIKGYYSLLNITKLGYLTFKLMINFQFSNPKIEAEIIDYLNKSKIVGWVVSCDGHFNLMSFFWVKNIYEFEKYYSKFLTKFSKYLKDRIVMLVTENHSCRKSYLYGKSKDDLPDTFYGDESKIILDEKDKKILNILANDAKTPFYKIGSSLKLTAEAIAYRVRKLKENDIIQAFRPIINSGYEYYNVLFKLKRFENIEKLFSYFKQHPNIIYFVKYLGDYDIGIDMEVKGNSKLREIIKTIKENFNQDIESYDVVLIYEEHKLSYFPSY